ncbi:hypothetical protein BASA50_002669 [Batrachochytrium salamandrivorans]|uniref:Extracellular metalloproteinase n=1 Tax=Batrachochytrium salamandrivorans TaxID=1357716 RepID=A0ABQ8FKM5_9FUNG|nr:hypothetical protein BASA50_002669 [Batrachochytrium salamandrivorans]
MVAVSFVLVLALVSSTVVAQPGTNGFVEIIACFRRRPTFVPTESTHRWIPLDEETPTPPSDEDPVEIGLKYILQNLNLRSNEFKVMKNFTDSSGATHVYGIPRHKGSFIRNHHAAAHIKNGQVFFYSATTINDDHALAKRSPTISKSTAKLSSKKAVKAAVDCLGDIVSKEDVKRDFTYTAIELPNESPRDGFSTIVNPENFQSSPNGWTEGYKLKGNNALVKFKRGTTLKTTIRGRFDGAFDPVLPPQISKNLEAGAINAFYAFTCRSSLVTNMVHDVLYQYGFTEKAGNFQKDNFKRGGKEGDPVIINVQNSERENSASFSTPPDGYPGVLNLHIYTTTNPNRDSALDNTVMIHELTHGLSSRLTGGAHEDTCMTETESRGLGEGYSDMMALIFTTKPEDTRNTIKVIAEYIKENPKGVRRYPYTTNMRINPLKYQDSIGEKDIHNLGTIWASLLFEVYWSLVNAYGFSANLHDATQKKGNIIFLQLFVGTLMIQPCNPTFDSAHDAMLAADDAYYGGIHKHLIRQGFAKRGLDPVSQSDPTMESSV